MSLSYHFNRTEMFVSIWNLLSFFFVIGVVFADLRLLETDLSSTNRLKSTVNALVNPQYASREQ